MRQLFTNDIFDKATKDRFFKYVQSMQAGECWLWIGSLTAAGYGQFYYKQYNTLAHRISYIMYFGHIPKGMLICHKCDVKRCINPYHLYAGTYSDNLQDKYDRNPDSHRRIFNFSKVSEKDSYTMKNLRAKGNTYEEIAKHFNVTRQTASRIINNKTTNFREV